MIRTLALLKERPKSVYLKDIAEASGVTLKWLEAFHAGRILNPGVINLEKLYNYLSGGNLNV